MLPLRRLVMLLVFGLALTAGNRLLCGQAPATAAKVPGRYQSRELFCERFSRIKAGMTPDEVRGVLGPADDVRKNDDPHRVTLDETWGYGADGHSGMPMLGWIAFYRGQVTAHSRAAPASKALPALGEGRLRVLLATVAATQSEDSDFLGHGAYNPRPVIAAVNALQPLGKDVGADVLRTYCALHSGSPDMDLNLFIVMRELFEMPPRDAVFASPQGAADPLGMAEVPVAQPGYLRAPMLGAPAWFPADPTLVPRFPALEYDGIPLLVNEGYFLAGVPEPASAHLEMLARDGTWRRQPLRPVDQPLDVPEEVCAALKNKLAGAGDHAHPDYDMLRDALSRQVLYLTDTAYRAPGDDQLDDLRRHRPSQLLKDAAPTIRKMGMKWDAAANRYVRGDGTTLPAQQHQWPPYRFTPKLNGPAGFSVTISITRWSPNWIDVEVLADHTGPQDPPFAVKVIDPTHPDKVLVAYPEPGAAHDHDGSWGESSGTQLRLGPDVRLQVIVTSDGHTQKSPV